MKKVLILVLVLGMVFYVSTACLAAKIGEAAVPYWMSYNSAASYNHWTCISASNITDTQVTIKMTFYDNNGSIYQDTDNLANAGIIQASGSYANYGDNSASYSVTFTLDANKTATVTLMSSTTAKFGYGTIEWSQNSDVVCSVIAHGYVQYESTISGTQYMRMLTLPINEGKPF